MKEVYKLKQIKELYLSPFDTSKKKKQATFTFLV